MSVMVTRRLMVVPMSVMVVPTSVMGITTVSAVVVSTAALTMVLLAILATTAQLIPEHDPADGHDCLPDSHDGLSCHGR